MFNSEFSPYTLDCHVEKLCNNLRPTVAARRLVEFCVSNDRNSWLGHPATAARIGAVRRFVEKRNFSSKRPFVVAVADQLGKVLPSSLEDRHHAQNLHQLILAFDPNTEVLQDRLRQRIIDLIATTVKTRPPSSIAPITALIAPTLLPFMESPVELGELHETMTELILSLYRGNTPNYNAAFNHLMAQKVHALTTELKRDGVSSSDLLEAELRRWDPQTPKQYLALFAFEAALTETTIFKKHSPALYTLNQKLQNMLIEWEVFRESHADESLLEKKAVALLPHVAYLSAIFEVIPEYPSSLSELATKYGKGLSQLTKYGFYGGVAMSDLLQVSRCFQVAADISDNAAATTTKVIGALGKLLEQAPHQIIIQLRDTLDVVEAALVKESDEENEVPYAGLLQCSEYLVMRKKFAHAVTRAFRTAYTDIQNWLESSHDTKNSRELYNHLTRFRDSFVVFCHAMSLFTGDKVESLNPTDFLHVPSYHPVQIEVERESEEDITHGDLLIPFDIQQSLPSEINNPLHDLHQQLLASTKMLYDAVVPVVDHFRELATHYHQQADEGDDATTKHHHENAVHLNEVVDTIACFETSMSLAVACAVLEKRAPSSNLAQQWAHDMVSIVALSDIEMHSQILNCRLHKVVAAIRHIADTARDRDLIEFPINDE